MYFLEKFKTLDFKDRDCQKRLVNTFVNAIFVYDDHIKLTFNFSDNPGNTVTLGDLDKVEAGSEFVRCALCPVLQKVGKLSNRSFPAFCFIYS